MKPGRLIAFVRPEMDHGPILSVDGAFFDEVHDRGWDISDHDMPSGDQWGLLVFEGWVEHTSGPDPDVVLVGEWRPLTHWEMCRLRCRMSVFPGAGEKSS
jgi:hypothetical protein